MRGEKEEKLTEELEQKDLHQLLVLELRSKKRIWRKATYFREEKRHLV